MDDKTISTVLGLPVIEDDRMPPNTALIVSGHARDLPKPPIDGTVTFLEGTPLFEPVKAVERCCDHSLDEHRGFAGCQHLLRHGRWAYCPCMAIVLIGVSR